jgi:2-polyprenyl-6-methoxyphenol hydroxylase-like FAD-dependent oxidoreductase
VEIYERTSAALADRGAGIVTHPPLHQDLVAAGAIWDGDLGVKVPGRAVLDRDGTIVVEKILPQIVTSWGLLYGSLKRAFGAEHYHFGRSALSVEIHPKRPILRLADGTAQEFDLVIGADGVNSRIRGQLFPQMQPRYAGYIAWRGVVDERDISPQARDILCERFTFGLPPGEQLIGYPIASASHETRRGKRRFNFVWYRPAEESTVLHDLLTDRAGHRHGLSIPADQIRPEVIRRMQADAAELLAPVFAEAIQRTRQPFIQPIVDLESPSMVVGRVVLIGDAAFVARPHVGMGVTKAAGDAAALARFAAVVESELDDALEKFSRQRRVYGAAVVMRARCLGAYMQTQQLTPEERVTAERFSTPEAVLSETAIDISLAGMMSGSFLPSGPSEVSSVDLPAGPVATAQ